MNSQNSTGPQELIDLLEQVKRQDVKKKVFGAWDYAPHRFNLGRPIAEEEVRSFENTLGIVLPREFREFLLIAGDGAAGPYYGIQRLARMEHQAASQEFPFTANASRDDVSELIADPMADIIAPDVCICHQGCDKYDCLIVRGPAVGTIWSDYTSDFGPIVPLQSSFTAWYRAWAHGCLRALQNEALIDDIAVGMSERQLMEVFKTPITRWPGTTAQTRYIAFRDVAATFQMSTDDQVLKINRFDISPNLAQTSPEPSGEC